MIFRICLVVLLATLLGACTSTAGKNDTPVEDRAGDTGAGMDDGTGTQSYGMSNDMGGGVSALDDPANPLSVRVIYFDYDSSEIQEQYRAAVEAHAAYLLAHPDVSIALEGHADERGSREYNLALGERRALAVKRQLTLLGAAPAQIRTVSYGEERPLDEGHDDFAWSQNRRVEFIY